MLNRRYPGHGTVDHLKTYSSSMNLVVVMYVVLLFVRSDSLDAQHLVLL
jgi:hypothetical protein